MNYTIRPVNSPVNASIFVPGSKSITNRALLLAALAKGESILSGVLFSEDTQVFIRALSDLGIKIIADHTNQTCHVFGTGGKFPNKNVKIDCKNAGTAARFLLAACSMSNGLFHFDGTPRLRERPLSKLLQILVDQGATLTPENAKNMPFTIQGISGMSGGTIFVPGDESSQFLSALLMTAPFSNSPVILQTGELVSRPYVALTCSMMQEFGVTVNNIDDNVFCISVPQSYKPQNYIIEPDLSTASYFFAMAAITGGKAVIPNINRCSCKQGDIRFLDILEAMGCVVGRINHNIVVQGPQKLMGVEVNMNDISDTFITLACLAPFADRPTTISGIAHTRVQESDRVEAVAENLTALGIQVEYGLDFITIYPGKPSPGLVDSYNDHRIAMAFAIMGLVVPGITINNINCVSKTCPNYVELLESVVND